ncbi:helix-turn-helix transcriptional regulator [Sporomusa sp. KB1]|jgi:AraC-like DNA-binding protein|uniref:helix-turn-helix transcriptional regulator n=1 Tax=Sporomusa sp. KB1 TaxID=943346 RepID=UPI0011A62231|nr:AraC family transcriptional regulator [Sporomusa sp. KB1]TWH46123.1 AraC family transcriptional regulator [Sporomusa sp. KB1]
MLKNTVKKYQIFNPKDENCPVCAGLSRIYRTDSFQNEMVIPEAVGKGYCRRIVVKPSMKISIGDMTFHEKMAMGGRQDNSLLRLAFCLGEGFLWRMEGNKQEYEIACGESCIFNRNQGISIISSYHPGQRILGLNIELDFEIITSLMQHWGKEHVNTRLSYGSSVFGNGKFSPAVRRILKEIMNCRYREQVKRIYLEGKILELIAVYLDESIFKSEEPYSSVRLSSCDREALHQARRILDEDITCPPTLGKLAKLICLNEYKLKTGFKELFGMPVHAYIIDKRLEQARLLIEDKKLRVTEVALLVGYNDLSYFAEKFRKKYGFNPSEYSKNL